MIDSRTVLMTSVGTDSFPMVLQAFRANPERNLRIVGVDIRPSAPGLYLADKAYLVPTRNDPAALLKRVFKICSEENVAVVLPGSTEDQEFFAAEADEFIKRGVFVMTSPLNALRVANDKLRLSDFARSHGIPCPEFESVTQWEQLETAIIRLGYPDLPFVIKLNRGTGAQGFKIVFPSLKPGQRMMDRDNRVVAFDEVRRWLQEMDAWPPMHVAEYLPGDEYSVDILCDRGSIISAVVRLRLATIYGLALHAEVVEQPDVEKVACDLVSKLGLSYVVNVQIRISREGIPKLIEINPRIPGTIGLTVASGVNMPYLALKLALGEAIVAPKPNVGMTILRFWDGVCVARSKLLL